MRLTVESADYPLDELCGFGCRANPRRPFVIVSRVLGKHIPVRPRRMVEIHQTLAKKIPTIPGPVTFIALAETAVGLGHGIFEEWLTLTGRDDAVFLHTTRYRLRETLAFSFQEPHSHAPCHLVYEPVEKHCQNLFANAKSLILIDDELTTGQTLVNLATNYLSYNDRVCQIIFVSLTDWLGQLRLTLAQRFGIPLRLVSLLQGSLKFEANPTFNAPETNAAFACGRGEGYSLQRNYGRLGVSQPISLETRLLTDRVMSSLGRRLLVLGTGEFAHPPFLLARLLENAGHDVLFQSTTRSPLLEGDALGAKLQFMDNYGEGIPNYLYNAGSRDIDDAIIGYEFMAPNSSHDLPEKLNARCVIF
ncbi:MAG: phosphoribosyltransferase family protein [Gemmataceae bacterium]|nr:phosphoribosyltransferase family protein [Gemmataceae bacterium]